jgi:hypothetical protein
MDTRTYQYSSSGDTAITYVHTGENIHIPAIRICNSSIAEEALGNPRIEFYTIVRYILDIAETAVTSNPRSSCT